MGPELHGSCVQLYLPAWIEAANEWRFRLQRMLMTFVMHQRVCMRALCANKHTKET